MQAAVSAYQAVVEQYGDNTQESYNYQKTLLEEQIKLQDLQDEIYETIEAMQQLSNVEGKMSRVSFENSGLGVSTAASINASTNTRNTDVNFTANLVLPDGKKFASYTFEPLADYAKANGTPILNPT